jgi:hypothetical protein
MVAAVRAVTNNIQVDDDSGRKGKGAKTYQTDRRRRRTSKGKGKSKSTRPNLTLIDQISFPSFSFSFGGSQRRHDHTDDGSSFLEVKRGVEKGNVGFLEGRGVGETSFEQKNDAVSSFEKEKKGKGNERERERVPLFGVVKMGKGSSALGKNIKMRPVSLVERVISVLFSKRGKPSNP